MRDGRETRDATTQPGDQLGNPAESEAALVASLRAGDEAAFMRLVARYQMAMVRLAQVYTGSREIAEEVTQDAWLAALTHLDQFQGRSSFKTWLFHILVNGARARGQREARSAPFSALAGAEDAEDAGGDEPSVAAERFRPGSAPYAGGWLNMPASWADIPEERLDARETRERILAAIQRLPAAQASVIRLRDVEGYAASEVCAALGVSEANQRVLLHRARSRVRQALESYFNGE